eukprot:1139765-Pelagomonas_calceolata.AAC.5
MKAKKDTGDVPFIYCTVPVALHHITDASSMDCTSIVTLADYLAAQNEQTQQPGAEWKLLPGGRDLNTMLWLHKLLSAAFSKFKVELLLYM